jgi:hypothetical protein
MKRLDQLRQKLESLKLDGFVVPRADEYQGEYVPADPLPLVTWQCRRSQAIAQRMKSHPGRAALVHAQAILDQATRAPTTD